MIIYIRKSTLFTVDPDVRFAREYNLPIGTLKDIWRRHRLLDYTIKELCDFYEIKTGRKTTIQAMSKWMWRTKIYSMTKPIIESGVNAVMSNFFKEYEQDVIKEITRNLKSSVNKNTKTLL